MNGLLSTRDAAQYLGCSWHTLNQSRTTGTLLRVKAPQHIKIGHSVKYKAEDLREWVERQAKIGGSE